MNHLGGYTSKRSGVQDKFLCCFFFRIKWRKSELVGKLNYFSWELSRQWLRFLLSWAFYLRLSTNRYWAHTCLPWKEQQKVRTPGQTEVLLFRWWSLRVDYRQGFDSHCSCFRKFMLSSLAGPCSYLEERFWAAHARSLLSKNEEKAAGLHRKPAGILELVAQNLARGRAHEQSGIWLQSIYKCWLRLSPDVDCPEKGPRK